VKIEAIGLYGFASRWHPVAEDSRNIMTPHVGRTQIRSNVVANNIFETRFIVCS